MQQPLVGHFRRRRVRATSLAAALLVVTGSTTGVTTGLTGVRAGMPPAAAALADGNIVTPGNLTGYGFDQCRAPDQHAMNRWLAYSPFLAAGIYISGNSRGCRDQPNLTARWISTQLAKGW